MTAQEAVEAPRFQTQHFYSSFAMHEFIPGKLNLESRIPRTTADQLASLGHIVSVTGPGAICRRRSLSRSAMAYSKAARTPAAAGSYSADRLERMRWPCALMLFATLLPAAPPAKSTHKKPAARRKVARAKRAPSYQVHPDAERYKEIQQALTEKGYFKGEVNGQWGDDSVSAMKQFQADQKLPDDGKISAPVLIGLGLGPKHE